MNPIGPTNSTDPTDSMNPLSRHELYTLAFTPRILNNKRWIKSVPRN